MEFWKILALAVFAVGGVRQGATTTTCPDFINSDDLPQDRFLTQLTDPCRYDKNVRPNTSTPFDVSVKVDVIHLEATQSQFTAHMAVQFTYRDNNLNFESLSPQRSLIFGGESLKERIWTPNVLLKDTVETTVMAIDSKDVLISIQADGLVTYGYKMVAKVDCWLQLQKFPFDHQTCQLVFSEWTYNATNLQLTWNAHSPLNFAPNLHFTEYVMDEVRFARDTNSGPYQEITSTAGVFSELTVQLKFHRDVGYYILDFFIPSYMLVVTAWVTFWLQADAGPPRATLGATTIVAFITLHLGMSKDLPKVSYMKASDIWFVGVMCFIFLSLAEFAFVNVIWRRKKQIQMKKPKTKYIIKGAVMPRRARDDLKRFEDSQNLSVISDSTESIDSKPSFGNYNSGDSQEYLNNGHDVINMPEEGGSMFSWTTMTPHEVAIYIDRMARIVFPCVFLVFNIFYWSFVYFATTTTCPDFKDSDELPQDRFLTQLTDPCRYDKNIRPNTSTPFDVSVRVDVIHLEATQSQFTIRMAVQVTYQDINLNFESLSPQRSLILGGESLKERIWTPDVLLKNTVDTKVIAIDSKDVLISIQADGLVTYGYKMVAKVDCWLQLQKFPFDHQTCQLVFSDRTYDATNLQLKWNALSPLNFAPNLHFTEYVMDDTDIGEDQEVTTTAGTFSGLTVQLRFHRDIGYYILDFFIPSYILVCTAWVTFWLRADDISPRGTLGALPSLAFITLHLGMSENLPKVSYMKASDIWFVGVMCFIFLSLAEFTFVNVIWRRKKHVQLKKPKAKYIIKGAVAPRRARDDLKRFVDGRNLSGIGNSTDSVDSKRSFVSRGFSFGAFGDLPSWGNYKSGDSQEGLNEDFITMPEDSGSVFSWTTMTPHEVAISVDRMARILFPCVFLVFNILYWSFVYCL